MSVEVPQITGPGYFDIEVAGESHYQRHLSKVCGPRCKEGERKEVRAQLALENDNQFDNMAVKVMIQGGLVGYLPRETARDFRRALVAGDLTAHPVFECPAIIRGGWDKGDGDIGHYGVWLDLPQDDD